MYKELKETTVKTCTQIVLEYKRFAYLMLNPTEPIENGIPMEPRGTLYAIADREGLQELYKAARFFMVQGVAVNLETSPLDADKCFIAF